MSTSSAILDGKGKKTSPHGFKVWVSKRMQQLVVRKLHRSHFFLFNILFFLLEFSLLWLHGKLNLSSWWCTHHLESQIFIERGDK